MAGSPLRSWALQEHGLIKSMGSSLVAMCGLLIAVASLVVEHQLLGLQASVVAAFELRVAAPGPRAQAQWLSCTGLAVLWHVASSWIKDQTCGSCIGGWILHHWATRKTLLIVFSPAGSLSIKWAPELAWCCHSDNICKILSIMLKTLNTQWMFPTTLWLAIWQWCCCCCSVY